MNVNISSRFSSAELTWTLRHDIVEEVLITCCEIDQLPEDCLHARLRSDARRYIFRGLQPRRVYDVRFFRYQEMALVLRKRFKTHHPGTQVWPYLPAKRLGARETDIYIKETDWAWFWFSIGKVILRKQRPRKKEDTRTH